MDKPKMNHSHKFLVAYLGEGSTTTRLTVNEIAEILLKIPEDKISLLYEEISRLASMFYPNSAIGKMFSPTCPEESSSLSSSEKEFLLYMKPIANRYQDDMLSECGGNNSVPVQDIFDYIIEDRYNLESTGDHHEKDEKEKPSTPTQEEPQIYAFQKKNKISKKTESVAKTMETRNSVSGDTSTSDGSTASYYELPKGATQLQDIISYLNLNAQLGEIMRSSFRYGKASHSDKMRDAKKIKFYIEAEINRLEKLNDKNN